MDKQKLERLNKLFDEWSKEFLSKCPDELKNYIVVRFSPEITSDNLEQVLQEMSKSEREDLREIIKSYLDKKEKK